jgi:hypothetical protein
MKDTWGLLVVVTCEKLWNTHFSLWMLYKKYSIVHGPLGLTLTHTLIRTSTTALIIFDVR